MRTIKNKLMIVLATAVLAVSVIAASAAPSGQRRTTDKIHKELVTLPYYGVFDNLAYKVEGDTVLVSKKPTSTM